jgi:hypothetical protein
MFWPWEVVERDHEIQHERFRSEYFAFKRALLGWRSSSVAGSERGAV